MLLPYASDRPAARTPLTVVLLVLFHYLVFALVWLVAATRGPEVATAWYANLALIPAAPHVWSCFSYSILHSDVLHLSVNMLFLWVFGGSVEEAVGWKRFLSLYILAAVLTGWVEVAMARVLPGADRSLPIVGASGAISAMVGVFAVRFYRARVRIIGLPTGVSAVVLLAIVMLSEMAVAVYHLTRPDAGLGQTSAHWAHLAGFILGLGFAQIARQSQAAREEYRLQDAAKELEGGDALAAVRRWEAILRSRPDDPEAEGELARAWELAEDAEQAQEHYRSAIAGFLKRGDRTAAAERAARLWSAYPEATVEPDAWFSCARALEDLAQFDRAAAAYSALLAAHPDHAQSAMTRLRLGEVRLRSLGDPSGAVAALERVVAENPESDLRGYAQTLLGEARAAVARRGGPDGG